MVRPITFILMMVTFFSAQFIFDRYFKKKGTDIKLRKVALVSIGIEALMVILASKITFFFYVLIYVTIVVASFITVFFRHKQSKDKLYKNAF